MTSNASNVRRSPLLSGKLRHSVLALALPALGEQMLNFCVGLFDTFLAGQVSGAGGETGVYTSTVGIASYMSWLATLLFALVGAGTTALVARHWGQGLYHEGRRFASGSMFLAAPLGLAVFALLYLAAPVYARLQNMHGESFDIAVHYLRTDAFGQLFFGFCLVGAAALRGAGDMRTPMLLLGAVNLFNMLLASTLVFGWGGFEPWGIRGIVGGTVASRILGGLLMLAVLATGFNRSDLRISFALPGWSDVRRILKIGGPAAIDGPLIWVGQSLFLMIIARLDDVSHSKAYMAAHIIGMEVEALTYLPAVAWGYAAATLIGQCLGAGDIARARQAGHESVRQCALVAVVASLVYVGCSASIYAVMTREPAVRAIGVPALRFLALYQVPLVVVIVYLTAMRGAGDTRSPLVINVIGMVFIRLPVGYLCGVVLHGGLIGAWTGMMVDVALRAGAAAYFYTRGRWAHATV